LLNRAPSPAGEFLLLQLKPKSSEDQLDSQINLLLSACDCIITGDLSDFSAVYQPLLTSDGKRINWFSDYNNGHEWPLCFYPKLDYTSERRTGDIRSMWEIHRHLFFATMSAGFLVGDNEDYAAWVSRHWKDWLNQSRIGFGIGWIAPQIQENAIRNISWILSYLFLQNSSAITASDRRVFRRAIFQQGCFINHYFNSKKAISHNHLVSEAGGLALTGMFFSNHSFGKRWLRRGLRTLEQATIFQVHSDGVQGEFSTNYHAFVLETAILVYCFGTRLGFQLDEEFRKALHGMLKHITAMTYPDGSLPQFGDTDNATAWALTPGRLQDRRRYASTGAVLFHDSELKNAADIFHLETWLLMGETSLQNWMDLPKSKKSVSEQNFFPSVNVLTSKQMGNELQEHLIIRGGGASFPPGIGTSHNHADYLSFTWWVEGEEVLIDPGTYSYSLDDKWRFYFRSAAAHNTITVDDESMLDVNRKRFGIPQIFPVQTKSRECCPDYSFLHLHYEKPAGLTRWQHERRFLHIYPGLLLIRDQVLCLGRHRLAVNFQLSGNYERDQIGHLLSLRRNKQGPILYFASSPDDITIDYGDDVQPAGWHSPRYGIREALTSVHARVMFTDITTFDTIIDARAAWQRGADACTLTLDQKEITLSEEGGFISLKGMETDFDRLFK